MTQPTAIIIAGMHRSGTSAAARTVNLLGAALGSRLMPAAEDNQRGFWEQAEIVPAQETLLLSLGRGWDSLLPLPNGWESDAATTTCEQQLRDICQREFNAAPLWAIKDPRLSLTLPLWVRLLAAESVTAKVMLVYRHPLEVAHSLTERDGFPPEKGLLLWLHYTLAADRGSRCLPRAWVSYDALLQDWRAELRRAGEQLDIGWPHWDTAQDAIDEFLSGDLRHHRAPAKDASANDLEQLACELYETLRQEQASGSTDLSRFDEYWQRYLALLAPLMPVLEGYERQLAGQRELAGSLQRMLADSEHARSDLSRQMQALRQQQDQERASWQQDLQRTEAQKEELRQVIDHIYASASWKITRPLRHARALLEPKESTS